ncbi:hypothetical protein B0H19DRAFT_1262207 [Mycena capillaripes]|nr:hypothetical protein B0H19DRAFT_1262207 [Mycena capillaripes]
MGFILALALSAVGHHHALAFRPPRVLFSFYPRNSLVIVVWSACRSFQLRSDCRTRGLHEWVQTSRPGLHAYATAVRAVSSRSRLFCSEQARPRPDQRMCARELRTSHFIEPPLAIILVPSSPVIVLPCARALVFVLSLAAPIPLSLRWPGFSSRPHSSSSRPPTRVPVLAPPCARGPDLCGAHFVVSVSLQVLIQTSLIFFPTRGAHCFGLRSFCATVLASVLVKRAHAIVSVPPSVRALVVLAYAVILCAPVFVNVSVMITVKAMSKILGNNGLGESDASDAK